MREDPPGPLLLQEHCAWSPGPIPTGRKAGVGVLSSSGPSPSFPFRWGRHFREMGPVFPRFCALGVSRLSP